MAFNASMPARLGRFRLVAPIGRGGMASVYLALAEVAEGVHREVAIKVMHPQLWGDGNEAVRTLVEEGKLAAQIRHPNVVAVEEVSTEDGCVYLVMEHVHGDTLLGLMRAAAQRGETIPPKIVGRIFADALLGLQTAHELKGADGRSLDIVHRDFTPGNILVGVDGYARLADFGIARARSRASTTATDAIKGKLGYMPAEQLLGQPLDHRVDVWAAGVVAWECLAGRPFRGADEEEYAFMLRVTEGRIEGLAAARPDVPTRISSAIGAALAPLESRIGSVRELRSRLLEAWPDLSAVAEPGEVGAYVEAMVPDVIAARRRAIEAAQRAGSAPLDTTLSVPPAPVTPAEGVSSPAAATTGTGGKRALAVGSMLFVAGAGALLFVSFGREPNPAPAAAQTAAAPPSSAPAEQGRATAIVSFAASAEPPVASASVVPRAALPGAYRRPKATARPGTELAPTPYKE